MKYILDIKNSGRKYDFNCYNCHTCHTYQDNAVSEDTRLVCTDDLDETARQYIDWS